MRRVPPPFSSARRSVVAALDQLLALAREMRGHSPTQERADAAPELADGERLRDVVVGPELEAEHLVELLAPGREHDDRHVALRSEPLAHLEAVERREHHVQHDEVDLLLAESLKRLLAVACLDDR